MVVWLIYYSACDGEINVRNPIYSLFYVLWCFFSFFFNAETSLSNQLCYMYFHLPVTMVWSEFGSYFEVIMVWSFVLVVIISRERISGNEKGQCLFSFVFDPGNAGSLLRAEIREVARANHIFLGETILSCGNYCYSQVYVTGLICTRTHISRCTLTITTWHMENIKKRIKFVLKFLLQNLFIFF